MLSGLLALTDAALFTGAALFINVAEQPARLQLDDRNLLLQWKTSYTRGTAMQAPLGMLGLVLGAVAWWQTSNLLFLAGGILMGANGPWTFLAVMPVNKILMGFDPAVPNDQIRPFIKRWNALHTVRTVLGAAATIAFIAALSPDL